MSRHAWTGALALGSAEAMLSAKPTRTPAFLWADSSGGLIAHLIRLRRIVSVYPRPPTLDKIRRVGDWSRSLMPMGGHCSNSGYVH